MSLFHSTLWNQIIQRCLKSRIERRGANRLHSACHPSRNISIMLLEPRILFDGAGLTTALDAVPQQESVSQNNLDSAQAALIRQETEKVLVQLPQPDSFYSFDQELISEGAGRYLKDEKSNNLAQWFIPGNQDPYRLCNGARNDLLELTHKGFIGDAVDYSNAFRSFIRLPAATLNGATDFTLSFWMKNHPRGLESQRIITASNDTDPYEFIFEQQFIDKQVNPTTGTEIDTQSRFRITFHGVTAYIDAPEFHSYYQYGEQHWTEWRLVTLTRSGTAFRLYIDDHMHEAGGFSDKKMEIKEGYLHLGYNQTLEYFNGCTCYQFYGVMDQLRFYNRPLTQEEVTSILQAEKKLSETIVAIEAKPYTKIDQPDLYQTPALPWQAQFDTRQLSEEPTSYFTFEPQYNRIDTVDDANYGSTRGDYFDTKNLSKLTNRVEDNPDGTHAGNAWSTQTTNRGYVAKDLGYFGSGLLLHDGRTDSSLYSERELLRDVDDFTLSFFNRGGPGGLSDPLRQIVQIINASGNALLRFDVSDDKGRLWVQTSERGIQTLEFNLSKRVRDNDWHQYTLKRSGASFSISIDGIIQGSLENTGLTGTLSSHVFRFSGYVPHNPHLGPTGGIYDEVMFWRKPLSDADILINYDRMSLEYDKVQAQRMEKGKETARNMVAESMLDYDPSHRALPLLGHWWTADSLQDQILDLERGYATLPYLGNPVRSVRDVTYDRIYPDVARYDYYETGSQWRNSAELLEAYNLPIIFTFSPTIEADLNTNFRFADIQADIEKTPNLVTDAAGLRYIKGANPREGIDYIKKDGDTYIVLNYIDTFGPVENWYNLGKYFGEDAYTQYLSSIYEKPPYIILLSNNEYDRSNQVVNGLGYSKRFNALYGQELEGKTQDQKLSIGYRMQEERNKIVFNALKQGFNDAVSQGWKDKTKLVGYNALWDLRLGMDIPFSGGHDPLTWTSPLVSTYFDGTSTEYYHHDFNGISDYRAWSPLTENMNLVTPMLYSLQQNKQFWTEISLWHGQDKKMNWYTKVWIPDEYDAERHIGSMQFAWWLNTPKSVRNFFYEPNSYVKQIREKEVYLEPIKNALKAIETDPVLQSFYRNSVLVPSDIEHPYVSSSYQREVDWFRSGNNNDLRSFLLDTSVMHMPWQLENNRYEKVPVSAIARMQVDPVTGQKRYLVYANYPAPYFEPRSAPRIARDVRIYIPDYGFIVVDVPQQGAFFLVDPAARTHVEAGKSNVSPVGLTVSFLPACGGNWVGKKLSGDGVDEQSPYSIMPPPRPASKWFDPSPRLTDFDSPSTWRGASSFFAPEILPPTAAGGPSVVVVLPEQTVQIGRAFSFQAKFDQAVTAGMTGIAVIKGATLEDGDSLPEWLKFDPATGTFAGTPPADAPAEMTIKVMVRDKQGHEAVRVFKVVLKPNGGQASLFREVPGGHKPMPDLPGRSSLNEQFARQGHRFAAAQRDALVARAARLAQIQSVRG